MLGSKDLETFTTPLPTITKVRLHCLDEFPLLSLIRAAECFHKVIQIQDDRIGSYANDANGVEKRACRKESIDAPKGLVIISQVFSE